MRDIVVTEVSSEDYPLWNSFVHNASRGTFFHRTGWADIISMATRRPYRILVCRNGEEILAGIILFENAKFGMNLATPVPLFPFNGPLIAGSADAGNHKTIARRLQYTELITGYMKNKYDYWILDTGYGFFDIRGFQWAGCDIQPVYTYRKDLTAAGDVERSYNQNLRRKIKEAESEGLTVREVDYTEKFSDLYHKSYGRHDMYPPVSAPMFEKILQMIIRLPQVKLFVAELNDSILAGRMILEDEMVVYDLLAGGDDPTGLGAGYLVHNLMTRYSKTHKIFDFMGAGHPRIEQFKRGYGGELALGFRVSARAKFPLSILVNLRNANLTRRRKL